MSVFLVVLSFFPGMESKPKPQPAAGHCSARCLIVDSSLQISPDLP